MIECPQCAGIGEGFSTAGGGMDIVKCHWCDGTGEVTAAKAEEYRKAKEAAAKVDFGEGPRTLCGGVTPKRAKPKTR